MTRISNQRPRSVAFRAAALVAACAAVIAALATEQRDCTVVVVTHRPATLQLADSVVLLVDDDRAVRSTTRRLLERSNFTVVDLEDGAEALSRFTADPAAFDVLLSDIRMPRMDGVQLAQAVRAVAPDFPVVFISGFEEPGAQPLDSLSSVQLVAKPFTSDRLFAALRRAISERVPKG
jgi:CheY-like chemotaxis protein